MRRIALAVTLTATLFAAACTTSAATPQAQWIPPSNTATGGPAAVGANIGWRPCQAEALKVNPQFPTAMTATCGTVTVPANWRTAKNGKPSDGKTMGIALLRITSRAAPAPHGNVLINPGGPGGSGRRLRGLIVAAFEDDRDLLSHFDLIGFDPRGVKPLQPGQLPLRRRPRRALRLRAGPGQRGFDQAWSRWTRRSGDACGAKYGDQLSLFSTEQAARDIDAIRVGLGDQKLNYLGFSYGTLLGATYAQLFPTNIRSMVLDGAVDPNVAPTDSSEGQAKGFEHAFDNFAAWCKAHAKAVPDRRTTRAAR